MFTKRKLTRQSKRKDKEEDSKTNSKYPMPPMYDTTVITYVSKVINRIMSEFLDHKPENLSNKEFFDSFRIEIKSLLVLCGLDEQYLRKEIIRFIQPDTPELYLEIFSDEDFIIALNYVNPIETIKLLYTMEQVNKKYIKGRLM